METAQTNLDYEFLSLFIPVSISKEEKRISGNGKYFNFYSNRDNN